MVLDFAFVVVIGVFFTPEKALGAATAVVVSVLTVDEVDFDDGNTPGENIVVAGGETAALATKNASSTRDTNGAIAMVAAMNVPRTTIRDFLCKSSIAIDICLLSLFSFDDDSFTTIPSRHCGLARTAMGPGEVKALTPRIEPSRRTRRRIVTS
jgi:hypothetical protein